MSGPARETKAPLALRPDVVATVLEEGALLLDLDTKYFYVLNASGWAMARLFEEGTTAEHVRAQCEAAGAPASDGVEAVIDTLVAENLLVPSEQDARPALELEGPWTTPEIERQAEPLQQVIVSAFDPSIPLAE